MSVAPTDGALAADRRQPLSTLTAARTALTVEEVDGVPWPERVLATRVGGLELMNLHSPVSPKPGLAKVLTHEAVHARLAAGSGPRAVCGDLNTPRKEHADGRVWTFARNEYGKLRPERGERWDRAELALINTPGARRGSPITPRWSHGWRGRDPAQPRPHPPTLRTNALAITGYRADVRGGPVALASA